MVLRVAVVDERAVGAELGEHRLRAVLPVEREHLLGVRVDRGDELASSPNDLRVARAGRCATASTPGALSAAASAASVGIGEKLFCAVIA